MDAAGGTMRTLLDGVAQLEDMTRAQPAVSEESLSAQLQALVGAASLLPNTAGNDGKHRLDTVAIAKRMWCAHPAPRLVVGFCQTRALVPRLGDAKSSLGDAESSLGDAESSLGDANQMAALQAGKYTRGCFIEPHDDTGFKDVQDATG